MAVKEGQHRGLFFKTLCASLFISLLSFSMLITVLAVHWGIYGYESALGTAQRLALYERQLLGDFGAFTLVSKNWVLQKNNTWMMQVASNVHKTTQKLNVSLDTQLDTMGFANEYQLVSSEIQTIKTKAHQVYILVGACFQVLYIKFLMCLAALPLLALTGLAGVIDGLNQRAIRKASLGRESTYVFHKSLPITRTLLVVILIMWFSLPFALNPTLFFLVLSVLVAVVMSISASRFKKYL